MPNQDSPPSITTPQLVIGVVIMLLLIMLMNSAVDWYSQNAAIERKKNRAAESERPMPDFRRRRESWHPPRPKDADEVESEDEAPPAIKPVIRDNTGVRYTGKRKNKGTPQLIVDPFPEDDARKK